MKKSRKYRYLMSIGLIVLMIILIISHKDKRPSPSAVITESSVNAVDGNGSYLPESNIPKEETVYDILETPEERTISASTETPEEETAYDISEPSEDERVSVSPETERPYGIEGIPRYEYTYMFPVDIVFASEESVKLVSDLYDKIGFEGEFQSGDETVYEFYRQKFALLLDGKVKIYDTEGNESLLYDRYIPKGRHQINIQAGDELYFFDMDGDELPELCVQGTSGTYVCKYDADTDQYMEWWGATDSGYNILGTRRISGDNCGDTEYLFLLDKDGYTECELIFTILYHSEKLYLVSIPDLEERVRDGKITYSMRQQMVYDEFGRTYYLRVTREQYKELIKGLYEARKKAKNYQVPFSYFLDPEV